MSYLHVDRNSFISDLRQNVIEVRFVKLDGNVRIMKATLHPSWLPEDTRTRDKINEAVNREQRNDVVTLWDTEAGTNGWRSIKLDTIISLQLMPSY